MVNRNWLGQKTGRGFYVYDKETRKRLGVNEELIELIKSQGDYSGGEIPGAKVIPAMINEAFLALQEHVCAAEDSVLRLWLGLG